MKKENEMNGEGQEGLTEILEVEIRAIVHTRYNIVTGIVEYSQDNGVTYEPMTDRMEKTILRKLKANGHNKITETVVRNILGSDFSPVFDPFLNYFENLPKWDGTTDHIADMCSLVTVTNNKFWNDWVTKWAVGIVAGCINDQVVNHQVLVLSGGQGIGKTTWLEYFVPKQLNEYASTGFLNPENKDARIQASECMLVNIDELASFSPKNIEAFKQLITQKKIRDRRPYGRNAETMPKRATFCGSTNEDMFLFDNENRRFLCFQATEIELELLELIDVDLVYAQAYALYNNGFQFWFNKEENKLIEINNTNFIQYSPEEEAILIRFSPWKESDNRIFNLRWTASDVMIFLSDQGILSRSSYNAQKVGKALKRLGYVSFKSNGRMLYNIKQR